MEQVLERVMKTYTMMVTLSAEEEADALARVKKHLANLRGDDTPLAVAGLRFLRGSRPSRKRTVSAA